MKSISRFNTYSLAGVCLAAILCLGQVVFAAEYKEYKIGMTNPRSGPQVVTGDAQIAGVEKAIMEINAKGGIDGVPLKVLYEDNQAKPTMAVTALQKLISVDKVPLALTTWATTQLAQAPIAERNKVVMINTGASTPELINCTQYIFHTIPNSANFLRILTNYMCQTLNQKGNWAILHVNQAEGKFLARFVSKMLGTYGVKNIFRDNWEDYAVTDFRPIISKALDTKPDTFYICGTSADGGACLKQLRDAGFKGPVMVNYGTQLIQRAGVGVYNTYLCEQVIPENQRIQALREYALNVKKLQTFAIQTVNNYDAVYLAAEAIKYAKDHYKGDYFTGEKLRQALREKRQFDNLSTPGILDLKTQILSRQLSVKTWVEKDGKPVDKVLKVYSQKEEDALPKVDF